MYVLSDFVNVSDLKSVIVSHTLTILTFFNRETQISGGYRPKKERKKLIIYRKGKYKQTVEIKVDRFPTVLKNSIKSHVSP